MGVRSISTTDDKPETAESAPEPESHGPQTDVHFDEFDLSEELLAGIAAAGYDHPTPVQVAAIPRILEGKEVVAQARTGTGKTAAFGLPLLELLDPDDSRPQALILSPTRELARQIAAELEKLRGKVRIRPVALYGGDPMPKQLRELDKGPQIVVGTPGRVLDHLRRGTLETKRVRWFVLDEADEMLSMGFAKELNAIMRFLPAGRKTMLFSATFPREIERLIEKHVAEPERLTLSSDSVVAGTVEHHYYHCGLGEKTEYLVSVLDDERVKSGIVFCNRRDETRMVANVLRRAGYHALPINSDLSQSERNEVMGAIKAKELRILVATDIASRGIDISQLDHVINYTVPESPDVYVHRTGRTGRVGRKGTAVTLVSGTELSSLRQIENIKGIEIEERKLPPEDQIMARRVERLLEDLQELAKIRSPEEKIRGDREDFLEVAKKLQEDSQNEQVIYLLLQSFFEGLKRQTASAARGTEAQAFAQENVDGGGDRRRGDDDDGDEDDDDRPPPKRRRPSSGRRSSGRRSSR